MARSSPLLSQDEFRRCAAEILSWEELSFEGKLHVTEAFLHTELRDTIAGSWACQWGDYFSKNEGVALNTAFCDTFKSIVSRFVRRAKRLLEEAKEDEAVTLMEEEAWEMDMELFSARGPVLRDLLKQFCRKQMGQSSLLTAIMVLKFEKKRSMVMERLPELVVRKIILLLLPSAPATV